MSSRSNRARTCVRERSDLDRRAYVAAAEVERETRSSQVDLEEMPGFLVDVRADDRRTLGTEHSARGLAHPSCRPGDDGGLALETALGHAEESLPAGAPSVGVVQPELGHDLGGEELELPEPHLAGHDAPVEEPYEVVARDLLEKRLDIALDVVDRPGDPDLARQEAIGEMFARCRHGTLLTG